MMHMIINRTRKDLTPDDFAELGRLAQAFYDEIPPEIELHGDWAAADGSCTFSLLESEDPALLERLQAPFRKYVEMEIVPVEPVTGWMRR